MCNCCSNCKYSHEKIHGFWCIQEQGYVAGHDVCLSHKYKENDKIELEEDDDLVK